MPLWIEEDIADHDRPTAIFAGFVPAHGSTQTGSQFPQLKWLGNVIIGSRIQRFHFSVLAILNCKHDNRQLRQGFANQPAHVDAVHSRHTDVQQQCVELARAH
ncbi:MAG TPA: hypothetical protein VL991_01020 [Terracidiphilus sp.]|nr:hypothetical protein [Terracidiphilus sp.]